MSLSLSLLHLSPAPLPSPATRLSLLRRLPPLRSFPHVPLPLLRSPPHRATIGPASVSGALLQDAGAAAAVLAGAYALVLAFDALTEKNLIQQSLSRKLVHILSGLLFTASWPIFRYFHLAILEVLLTYYMSTVFQLTMQNLDSNSMDARYFASIVPMVNCLRLVINGISLATDEGLVKSVTREGNPGELLRGPLYYVLMLILCAVMFWRESPTGIISVAMMCGGDGMADIVGRRFGSIKLPYNKQKSWAGSVAMFVFGFLVSMGMLCYFSALGYFQLEWIKTAQRVALISLVATVVESLPTTMVIDDNISVPLVSMLTAILTFPS